MQATMTKILSGKQAAKAPVIGVRNGTEAWFFMMCNRVAVQYLRDTKGKDKALFAAEFQYEQQAASGQGDKPIVRALDDLKALL
jgi:hypothetical protein